MTQRGRWSRTTCPAKCSCGISGLYRLKDVDRHRADLADRRRRTAAGVTAATRSRADCRPSDLATSIGACCRTGRCDRGGSRDPGLRVRRRVGSIVQRSGARACRIRFGGCVPSGAGGSGARAHGGASDRDRRGCREGSKGLITRTGTRCRDQSTDERGCADEQVGDGPSGVAIGGGFVWVANALGASVSQIDPRTNSVAQDIEASRAPVGDRVRAGRGTGRRCERT